MKPHGLASHPLYSTWYMMLYRCQNPTSISWKYYGGHPKHPVSVCERWQDFAAFLADMGERPEAHTLDRIDPLGSYEPGNTRWADAETQANNKRPKDST